ncbi:hypothetical protein [Massilia sp. Leaf139]|uniref:hypothetical protein n=1 Tax=Massilia sp. Leaf139 TaxID=1736272 RepID=UPI0006FE7182|nr:hypothetical protein [Massilia sp. Leaf139]KQQ87225.1 hypothetical protein ASF77_16695 [Massilia sp. Leaf139]
MRVQVTQFAPHGSPIVVAVVASAFTLKDAAEPVLKKVAEHYPALPVMLVSIEPNGFRAYAPFQTGELLALLQLEQLHFEEIDISLPPEDDAPLPF